MTDQKPCNDTVSCSSGNNGETERERDESDDDLRWGWRSFKPEWLQFLNSPLGLLVVFSSCSFVYGMSVNGFNIAAITTLEKRFHLNSKQTGLIASINEVSSLIVTLFVSFFGSYGNKPRWIGLSIGLVGLSLIMFALPHFLVEKYDPPQAKHASQFCQKRNTTDGFCQEESISFAWSYFMIFLLSQVIAGAGGATLYSIGIAYLDENVNPKLTSKYIGVYYTSAFLGPSIGFVLAGQLLSTYVDIDQPDGLNLTPFDSRWIGNWWIGSLISGFLIFIFVFLILAYPKQLPKAVIIRQQAIDNNEIPPNNDKLSGKLKDIFPATKRLLLNPVYMYQTMGVWAQVIIGSGVAPFLFKLVRTHYGATQALAGLGVGLIFGISACFGTMIGAFYDRKSTLKGSSCTVAAKYCFYFQLVGMWMCLMFLLPGCEDIRIPDAHKNSSYVKQCNCEAVKYVPVCRNEITYYSACHAGCPSQNTSLLVYSNCSFVNRSAENTINLAPTKFGECDRGCKNLEIFITGFILLLTLSYLNDIPGKIVTIRSVAENQRSYALGLQLVIWRVAGALPGPVIFGSFIDKSCISWRMSCGQKGDCLAYRTKDVVFVIIIGSLIFQVLSITFFLLSWYYSCKKPLENLNHSPLQNNTLALEANNGDCFRGNGVTGVENPVGVEKIIEDECTPQVLDTHF